MGLRTREDVPPANIGRAVTNAARDGQPKGGHGGDEDAGTAPFIHRPQGRSIRRVFTDPADPLAWRTIPGSYNNLDDPLAGATGCRFGRNVPLTRVYRDEPAQLLEPNPRLISRRLLAREQFQPATTLNLLAAAWIQFEVHDWLSHRTVNQQPWEIPLEPDDQWPEPPMTIKRTE